MLIDQTFGPVLPEQDWVPAPRYSLRRNRVLKVCANWHPGQLLEIGCGTGALLHEFGLQGHICTGQDESSTARSIAEAVNAPLSNVKIVRKPSPEWALAFDYLLAFEVLEHIEDDLGTLKQWHKWLKPGGQVLLSVPAHQRRWTATDVWAGHFRRYERVQLSEIVSSAGFDVILIECYGFPIANLVDPIRAWNHARILKRKTESNEEIDRATLNRQSGVSRSFEAKLFPLQKSWLGKVAFQIGFTMQGLTRKTDLGTGYILLATRESK